MVETTGSIGIRQTPTRSPGEILKENYEKRQMVRRDLRQKELEEKGKNGELNTREAMELSSYKVENALEKIAAMTAPHVCYMA